MARGERGLIGARPADQPVQPAYGNIPPVAARYYWLDATVRDQAIAGTLPPESLPKLIDPSSPLAEAGNGNINANHAQRFTFDVDPDTQTLKVREIPQTWDRTVTTFMTAIPDATHFMVAWSTLIELMVEGFPENPMAMFAALHWYGRWIVEASFTYTWESICRYHLSVTRRRFIGEFHVDRWYEKLDIVQLHRLDRLPPVEPTPPADIRQGKGKRHRSANRVERNKARKRQRQTSKKVDNAKARKRGVCIKYNHDGCAGCRRMHVCQRCWPEKELEHKHTWAGCPSRKGPIVVDDDDEDRARDEDED